MSIEDKVQKIVSSWFTTAALLGVYAVAMAAATMIEARDGTPAAREIVYGSWWFILLHIALCINFVAIGIKQKLLHRKRWGALLLHYGFIVILAGAYVTHVFGYEGIMHIRDGESTNRIVMGGTTMKEVPFTVQLKDFRLERYHGSNSPSSYQSDVVITYDGVPTETEIYMNNIAKVAGFRIYQTSYDSDQMGTVLTVSSDFWGTMITYIGYLMLTLGLFISVLQRNSRFRTLYSQLSKQTLLVLAMTVGLSVAAFDVASAQGVKTVDPAHAKRFGELMIQSPEGRVHPVNTFSSEVLRKIYHRNSYNGMNSDQFLLSLIADPYHWSSLPIIYISSDELRERFAGGGKHASFNSMFDSQGKYMIGQQVEQIYAKPPKERTKLDKELMKLDEKVNILYSLFNGGMMAMFPADGHERWFSSGDDLSQLRGMDSVFIGKVMNWHNTELSAGNTKVASEVIDMITKFQAGKTAALNVDKSVISAELLYNRADIFRWCFRLYLIMGFTLMCFAISGMLKSSSTAKLATTALTVLIVAVFAYQTFGIALRWYISGRAPWANAYESMVYVAWTTVLSGLIFAKRSSLVLALATLLGGVILFVSNLNWLDPQITPLVPVLKSYWLMLHVSVITASYGFFGICAMIGITSLIMIILRREVTDLRVINELSMTIGLILLTLGIFMGAVWANESWGRYWGWDPKETWALITMVLYAFVTHSRFLPKLNNNFAFSAMSVVTFLSVLMTYFGVNFYLSGLHSYGKSEQISSSIVLVIVAVIAVLIGCAWVRVRKKQIK